MDKELDDAVGEIAEGLGFEASEEEELEPGEGEATLGEPGEGEGEGASEEIVDPELEPAPKEDEEPKEGEDETLTPSPKEPPKTWRPEALKEWESLSPTVQDEILKREEDIFKGLEQYKTDATYGKAFQTALEPFMPVLQQHGIDPIKQAQGLFEAHHKLSLASPQEKLEMFQRLAQHYQVPIEGMQGTGQEGFIDPELQSLREQVTSLQNTLNQQQQSVAQTERQKIQSEIEAFASDPKNVYFNEVASDVAKYLKGRVANTLEEAYNMAIKLNPEVQAKEQARLTAEADAKAKKAAEEKVRKAKKASSTNVTTSTKKTGGTATVGSMDDTLNETLENIKSRA